VPKRSRLSATREGPRHLRRWARLGISKRYVIEWNGKPVQRINKGFRSARRLAGLDAEVVPHTLRHTCATWLAQKRVPIHEICGFLGMTPETFERVYGHHHPDFQARAVNALSGQASDSFTATERERPWPKVVKLYEIPEFFASATRSGRGVGVAGSNPATPTTNSKAGLACRTR
jgi:hypothetical protein